jgi:hypothetical protein
MLNQTTVPELFGTPIGKFCALVVFLSALILDHRVGVLVGIAVVLSIVFAEMNNQEDFMESHTQLQSFTQDADKDEADDSDLEVDDADITAKPEAMSPGSIEPADDEEELTNYAPVQF